MLMPKRMAALIVCGTLLPILAAGCGSATEPAAATSKSDETTGSQRSGFDRSDTSDKKIEFVSRARAALREMNGQPSGDRTLMIQGLLNALQDSDVNVATEASDALVSIGRSAVELLCKDFQAEGASIEGRCRIAWVLGRIGNDADSAVAHLAHALNVPPGGSGLLINGSNNLKSGLALSDGQSALRELEVVFIADALSKINAHSNITLDALYRKLNATERILSLWTPTEQSLPDSVPALRDPLRDIESERRLAMRPADGFPGIDKTLPELDKCRNSLSSWLYRFAHKPLPTVPPTLEQVERLLKSFEEPERYVLDATLEDRMVATWQAETIMDALATLPGHNHERIPLLVEMWRTELRGVAQNTVVSIGAPVVPSLREVARFGDRAEDRADAVGLIAEILTSTQRVNPGRRLEIVSMFREVVQKEQIVMVRTQVARSLTTLRWPAGPVVDGLIDLLNDADAGVRAEAAKGLSVVAQHNETAIAASQKAIHPLQSALQDENELVRKAAQDAINSIQRNTP